MADRMQRAFKVEITAPCGRANYDGGEMILHDLDSKERFFGVGKFMEMFRELKLRDDDEVEVSVTVKKRRVRGA